MKVADLKAKLGIEFDKKSSVKAKAELKRAVQGMERATAKSMKVGMGSGIGKTARGLNTSLGRMAGGAARTALLGGVGAAVGASAFGIKDFMEFDKALVKFDISSQGAAGSMKDVGAQVKGLSSKFGMTKSELLAGAQAYVAFTGNGKDAIDSLSTFAKVATASGTPLQDITAAAGAMGVNFGIASGDMEKTFSILIKGGKEGAVELNELATVFADVAPAWNSLADSKGPEGVAKMSAALQVARRSFGSTSQAATGFESFVGQLTAPETAKKLKKAGVDIWEKGPGGVERMRSFDALLADMAQITPKRLSEIFRDKEGKKFIQTLVAAQGEYQALSKETLNATDVADDSAKVMASSSFKVSAAWNKFKLMLADTFEKVGPKLAAFMEGIIPMIQDLITKMGKALGMAVDLGKFIFDAEARQAQAEDDREQFKQEALQSNNPLMRAMAGVGGMDTARLGMDAAIRQKVQGVQGGGEAAAQRVFGFTPKTVEGRAFEAASNMQGLVNNVTINAPNADAKEVAKLVRLEMEKSIRNAFNLGAE